MVFGRLERGGQLLGGGGELEVGEAATQLTVGGVLGAAQLLPGAGAPRRWRATSLSGGGEDLDVQLAEACRDRDGLANRPGETL